MIADCLSWLPLLPGPVPSKQGEDVAFTDKDAAMASEFKTSLFCMEKKRTNVGKSTKQIILILLGRNLLLLLYVFSQRHL